MEWFCTPRNTKFSVHKIGSSKSEWTTLLQCPRIVRATNIVATPNVVATAAHARSALFLRFAILSVTAVSVCTVEIQVENRGGIVPRATTLASNWFGSKSIQWLIVRNGHYRHKYTIESNPAPYIYIYIYTYYLRCSCYSNKAILQVNASTDMMSWPLELVESRVHTYTSQKPTTPRERHPRIYTPLQTPPQRQYKTNPRHTNEHHEIHRNLLVTISFIYDTIVWTTAGATPLMWQFGKQFRLSLVGIEEWITGIRANVCPNRSMNHWGSNRHLSQSKKRWNVSPWILTSFVYNPGILFFAMIYTSIQQWMWGIRFRI
jgi:hypothetical protein